MGDKTDTTESTDSGDPTEGGDYEDDFEKDLEWLINEEEKRISSDIQVFIKYYMALLHQYLNCILKCMAIK